MINAGNAGEVRVTVRSALEIDFFWATIASNSVQQSITHPRV